jgi:hypothetical protein
VASLRDADLSLKLGAREIQQRIAQAQRRLLALRLQMGGLIGGGKLGPPLGVVDSALLGPPRREYPAPVLPRDRLELISGEAAVGECVQKRG